MCFDNKQIFTNILNGGNIPAPEYNLPEFSTVISNLIVLRYTFKM